MFLEKIYTYTDNKCHGSKHSKERITVMVGANMAGTEKLKLLVIGKIQNPIAMKYVKKKSLPVTYEADKKAWMVSGVYRRWLNNFLLKIEKFCYFWTIVQVIYDLEVYLYFILFYFLFYFSLTAHPKSAQADLNLKSIQIAFFPANMTSVVQPMDLGIIKCLKHH
jgi:DDE superfamily endonuclease